LNEQEHKALGDMIFAVEQGISNITAIVGSAYGIDFMQRWSKVEERMMQLRWRLERDAGVYAEHYLTRDKKRSLSSDELRAKIRGWEGPPHLFDKEDV
jgi:hypothetical protein